MYEETQLPPAVYPIKWHAETHDNKEESVLKAMMVEDVTCLALKSVNYSALAL
jgi:hypothetical protein